MGAKQQHFLRTPQINLPEHIEQPANKLGYERLASAVRLPDGCVQANSETTSSRCFYCTWRQSLLSHTEAQMRSRSTAVQTHPLRRRLALCCCPQPCQTSRSVTYSLS